MRSPSRLQPPSRRHPSQALAAAYGQQAWKRYSLLGLPLAAAALLLLSSLL